MTFDELSLQLEKECNCRSHRGDSNSELTHFSFVSEKTRLDDPSCLYIGDLPSEKFTLNGSCGYCFLTTRDDYPDNVSYIVTSPECLMDCMNALTSAFFRTSATATEFEHLSDLASQGVSVKELVNKAALFFDRSLVVTDLSFRILEYSTSVTITDPIWVMNVSRGNCTYEFIEAMNALMPAGSLPPSSECFQVSCSSSTENKLCSQLFYDNHAIGYLVLLDNNRGLLPYHRQYLAKLSDLLVTDMLRGSFHSQLFSSPDKNMYIQLLENGEALQDKKASEIPDCSPTSICLVFRADNHSKHDLFYIKRTLESLYPQGTIFIYKELVIMVSDNDRIVELIESNIDQFKHVREIGVSAIFGKITDFPEQFQHAQEACRLGKQIGHPGKIHKYERYRFYHLLENVSDIGLMKSCIHPALLRLHEYDLSHDFSLIETLRVFIECSCSAKEAAGKLFLHRNTMIYRLGKIQELTGLELSDAEVVFHLQYSYRINDLLHLI